MRIFKTNINPTVVGLIHVKPIFLENISNLKDINQDNYIKKSPQNLKFWVTN